MVRPTRVKADLIKVLILILSFITGIKEEPLFASNFNWIQSDWSGGSDPGAIASHPGDQTNWIKFFGKDASVNNSIPGEISISPRPASWTQTGDVSDFDTGTLSNVKIVGNGNYVTTRYEETSPSVSNTGTWNVYYSSAYSGGGITYSNAAGSTVSVSFTGVNVSWIGSKINTMGIANVYIDNAFKGSVDLYSSTTLNQQVLWSITGLSNTTHILKIEVTGNRNPNATGSYVNVDAFDVSVPNPDPGAYLMLVDGTRSWTQTGDIMDFDTGTLSNVKIVGNGNYVTTRYEETSPSVSKTGTWSVYYSSAYSGGGITYSNAAGSTVSVSFTGVNVSWIGSKINTMGIANVYIDNAFKGSVDLYSSTTLNQQVLWSITGLLNTTHILKIEVTGSRNPSATDSYVNVDAFDIVAANPDPGAYLMLVDGATSGVYESPSFDTGSVGALFLSITWNATIPLGSTLKFQIGTNNDNQTWNFKGPDGTSNTYYVTSGTALYSGHNGNRYIKYRAFLDRQTVNPADSPILNDVTIIYGPTSFLHGIYESPSFDIGLGGAFYDSIAWTATIPAGSSLRFQIATNNNNSTWNFVGPDGTANTYYLTSGTVIYSGHNGNQYIKYRAFLDRQTVASADSPILNDVTINYKVNPSSQFLISSPYDTTDSTNVINRLRWSEKLPSSTDIVLQLRTSPNGTTWGPWYGPNATTFSASSGVTQITVANTTGFSVGSRVTLTNSTNASQEEIKKITAINTTTKVVTLDSATSYIYASGSYFTDSYTDPAGTEPINPVHRSGYSGVNDDRWMQYRVFLLTLSGTVSPIFLENRIVYFTASAVYQPDGVIEGDGDNVYGPFGSGAGGTFLKDVDPGFMLQQPIIYDIRIQNDGTIESIDDTYTLSWNTPSDVSGSWTVFLNDGVTDLTSPASVSLNVRSEKIYSLKVTPSPNAPADSTQDIILNIRSESDYAKVDSVKATARIKRAYQVDGLIDGVGDNLYDLNRGGGGGISLQKNALPGDTILYSVTVQNEGNIADPYTLSLLNPPPNGWTVLINDGSKDYDITNPSIGFTTPTIRSLPYSDFVKTYTLKVIPKGAPAAVDIILNIYSNGGMRYLDSLTARLLLQSFYRVDGVIYGYGYDTTGVIGGYGVMGSGCGTAGPGDNVYGVLGSGNGGCTAVDILGGSSRDITVGVQNEGNVQDRYQISWNTPSGWSIVMQERLNDGSVVGYSTSPVTVPTAAAGNPPGYNGGEIPFFTFKITPPASFTSGSQTVTFDIQSIGNSSKGDSVKAVINSSDTTPPGSVALSLGSITTTSVKVSWTAPGDDGGSGTATSYDLRYSTSPITATNFTQATRVSSCKTGESNLGKPKSAGSSESCTLSRLFANTDYYFALKTSDEAGNVSSLSTCSGCPAHTLTSNDTAAPGTITDLSITDTTVTRDPATLKEMVKATVCWTATADDGTSLSSGDVTGYDLRYSTRYIVDDGASPGVGQVKFSSAVSANPDGGWLSAKSSGMKECYIVTVENKINTGGGIMEDRTRNTRFYFALKALDEARNKSSLSNIAGVLTPLVPNAYNMVSVPYRPTPAAPVDVFGDDVGTPLYTYWWNSMGPNLDSGCYDGEPAPYSNDPAKYTCQKLTAIKEGLGYFLWVPQKSVILDAPSGSTQPPTQSCVDDVGSTFPCYVMTLNGGWNMIGPPFDKEINFSSRNVGGTIERGLYVRRTSGSKVDVAKFQDAVTAMNWIDGSVYTYNGVNYNYETCAKDNAGEPLGTRCSLVMQPWKAYWIRLHVQGNATFELLVPY